MEKGQYYCYIHKIDYSGKQDISVFTIKEELPNEYIVDFIISKKTAIYFIGKKSLMAKKSVPIDREVYSIQELKDLHPELFI